MLIPHSTKSVDHRARIGDALRGNQNGLGRRDNEEVRARRRASLKAAWARRKMASSDTIPIKIDEV